jgi:hypothetical protein
MDQGRNYNGSGEWTEWWWKYIRKLGGIAKGKPEKIDRYRHIC